MSNLSQILADSNWGQESARINQNFQNLNADLEKVKSATTKFKGYFISETGLKSKYPSPKEGDTAWVGEPYPGTVYDVQTDGQWHNTGKAPDTGSVELQDYAKKAELTELEGKVGGVGYVTCDTAAGTAAKVITVTGLTVLSTGIRLLVKMTYNNTAGNATLNINGLGENPLYYNNSRVSGDNAWEAGEVIDLYYDGTNFYSGNFQGGSSEGGNMILEWNTDSATTRKQVKQSDRKSLLQISYKDAEGNPVNEQYIGSTFTDTEWEKDSNWSSILTEEKDLSVKVNTETSSGFYEIPDVIPNARINNPNSLIEANSLFYVVVIDISKDKEIVALNGNSNLSDATFKPFSVNVKPSGTGAVTKIEDATVDGNKASFTQGNYALLMCYSSKDLLVLHGAKVIKRVGGVFEGTSISVGSYRLNGNKVTEETLNEGEIFPLIKNLIGNPTKSKNLLNPELIDYSKYINASTGVIANATNKGLATIKDIKANTWYCFSSNQDLNLAGFAGLSIQYENNVLCYRTGSGYTISGGIFSLDFEQQTETYGFKFRINSNAEYPMTAYIYVGQKAQNSNLQLEEGETPTDYEPYGTGGGGSDLSEQVNNLSKRVTALQAQIEDVKSVPSRWAGCKYGAFGDSITDDSVAPERKYCDILAESLACTLYENNGFSGDTMTKMEGAGNNFISRIPTFDFTKYELMTMLYGINDFTYGCEIGSIDDEINDATFIGAYRKAIETIFKANATVRIILFTPFNTATEANSKGHNLVEYANAVLKVGEYYSLPVIDLFRNAGMSSRCNFQPTFGSGVHPNALGHEFAGGYIVSQVKNM